MLVLEKSRNNAVETLGSLRAIVLQTPSFLCAAPNENGHGVNFLHLESKFYFRMHLYFILCFILSPVIFCSQSIFSLLRLKLCLVPISFRQEKIMSHCSPLIFAQVLVLYEKLQIKSSLYDHLLHLFFGQMSNEFFLVSVVCYFLFQFPVIFCSKSIFSLMRFKPCLVPIYSRHEKVMSHCSLLLLLFAQVLAT